MQACHWKAHNTFTNFTFKTLLRQIITTLFPPDIREGSRGGTTSHCPSNVWLLNFLCYLVSHIVILFFSYIGTA